MPRASARVGNTHGLIASLSFQAAKINGWFRKPEPPLQPRSPYGRNSYVTTCCQTRSSGYVEVCFPPDRDQIADIGPLRFRAIWRLMHCNMSANRKILSREGLSDVQLFV